MKRNLIKIQILPADLKKKIVERELGKYNIEGPK